MNIAEYKIVFNLADVRSAEQIWHKLIERLWRSLKQETINREEIDDGFKARRVMKEPEVLIVVCYSLGNSRS